MFEQNYILSGALVNNFKIFLWYMKIIDKNKNFKIYNIYEYNNIIKLGIKFEEVFWGIFINI